MPETFVSVIEAIRGLERRRQAIQIRFDPNHPSNEGLGPLSREERLSLTAELREIEQEIPELQARLDDTGTLLCVAIRACVMRDDDGNRETNISPDEVTAWVNNASRIFRVAGVQFEFDAQTDFVVLESTAMNSVEAADARNNTPRWQRAREFGNREADAHSGKIVVFFRFGSGVRQTGAGFSTDDRQDYRFVVMPGWRSETNEVLRHLCGHSILGLLGHELGHYLGLEHTFRGRSLDYWQPLDELVATSIPAAVTVGVGEYKVYARGQDRAIWTKTVRDNEPGSPWTTLGGTHGSAPFAVATSDGGEHVFALGQGTLRHVFRNSGPWSSWVPIFDGVRMPISPVEVDDGSVHLFAERTDGQVWHIVHRNGVWGSGVPLGAAASAPSAISSPGGRMDLFVRGAGGVLLQNTFQGDRWGVWVSRGGRLRGRPVAVAIPGAIHVLVRWDDESLRHIWANNDVWHPRWESRGGRITGAPVALTTGDGFVHVLARGGNDRIWHTRGGTADWTGWQQVSETLTQWRPAVASARTGRIDVFVQSPGPAEGRISRKWLIGDLWSDAEGFLIDQGNNGSALNGDLRVVNDTDPDPVLRGRDWRCDQTRRRVVLNGIEFALQRNNIMSYNDGSPKTLSPGQARRVRDLCSRLV